MSAVRTFCGAGVGHVKFGMQMDRKRTHRLYLKHFVGQEGQSGNLRNIDVVASRYNSHAVAEILLDWRCVSVVLVVSSDRSA
jgi:hypothetical protein